MYLLFEGKERKVATAYTTHFVSFHIYSRELDKNYIETKIWGIVCHILIM